MATQLEYEVYTRQHRQKLMQIAQTSRELNKIRKYTPRVKPGFSFIISWAKRKAMKMDFGSKVQTTRKTGDEKTLISS
jgi:hypothetical protein